MAEGDTLVLIGETHGELGASIYLREILGREDERPAAGRSGRRAQDTATSCAA
ncbi:hypothetical protein ACRAWD_25515 [Caulobacter segnis]